MATTGTVQQPTTTALGSSDDARASTRRAPNLGRVLAARLACARVDSRETTHSSRARFPLGPDATRAEGRATARRAFLTAASDERVFTAPRPPSPRCWMAGAVAPALAARSAPSRAGRTRGSSRRVVRYVRVSPAPDGSFPSLHRSRPSPRRASATRRTRFRRVPPRAADPPRASPLPDPHTQPSRVQTVHRRRERPSRPRGRPSRPTTPTPRAARGRATGRRHPY